ncbi:MAG TPA: efflux RND transporter periplasmic adaptor subunit, partial [Rhodothermales bacterium]|nr:efflux RND transporter periplasmic adaptor subunit [Rhodothermales bacterium]
TPADLPPKFRAKVLAEARLREAREQLNKTSIFAPMSGVVSQLNVELGERVVGTSQMSGTEMMRIARLDQMEVQVDVNENDVVNVAVGDTANVSVDAYPERVFKGVVTEIANSARTTGTGTQDQVTNFPVKVRLVGQTPLAAENVKRNLKSMPSAEETPVQVTQAEFRPGMSGTVDISTDTVVNSVAIPIQAVTVRDFAKPKGQQAKGAVKTEEETPAEAANPNPVKKKEDLRKVVFVMRDGKAYMVQVETGISNETHVEIKSGLSGTEKVIIGPYSIVSRELENGEAVRTRKVDTDKK